ncbi:MAG: hypothetical protein A2289_06610 [Deltaproteobacteria bacterium RIFOXYA12_FULL_58_15]|nr:MAG: hypothetical protein A2289_06610 [Deltaproteobacteria bacterium RIFOXYA12_FULL_58_15]
MRTGFQIFVMAGLCACAQPESATELTFNPQVRWSTAVDCPYADDIGGALRAVLDLGGGYPSCPLVVDRDTLVATGTCGPILAGIISYVGLDYYYERGVGQPVSLSYAVGWVDLRQSALKSGKDVVEVDLTGDGTTSCFIDTPDELNAMAIEDCALIDNDELNNLCNAKHWAAEILTEREYTLDLNHDGTANLEQACTSGLEAP